MSTKYDDSPLMNLTEKKVEVNFKKESQIKEVWRRLKKDKLAMFGLSVIVLMIVIALCAPLIRPYSAAIKMNMRLKLALPSAAHWFGCDGYGRDLFTRCLYGSRVSLTIGFATAFATLVIGSMLGALVGYVGGVLDDVVMRALDIFSAIPSTLFAMAVVAAMGSGIFNICVAISLTNIPGFVRIVRSAVLSIIGTDYIEAARACGTSDMRIIFRHILPNAMGPILVQATQTVARSVITVSSLSFIGLGISEPTPEWGAMLSAAKSQLRYHPYLAVSPGIAIVMVVVSLTLLGDGLRDAMDPRLKN